MEKNVRMCMLLDIYFSLLTQKQQECMRLYYEEDLSLSEISELLSISRQGVRDCLKKAENALPGNAEQFAYFRERKILLVI